MKLSKDKIKECAAWVEENGLYPQRCGASIKQFCEAQGITFKTYQSWCENSTFSNAVTRAREVFKQNTVHEVVNALVKAAKGVDFTKTKEEGRAQVVKEYDPKTGKKVKEYTTEKLVTVKATRESYYYPPDVKAATFLLTNLDPENWKNKQDTTSELNLTMDEAPVIMFGTTTAGDTEPKDPAPEQEQNQDQQQ